MSGREPRDERQSGEPRDIRDPRLAGDVRDPRDLPLTMEELDSQEQLRAARAAFPSDRLIRAAALVMIVLVIIGVMALTGLVLRQGREDDARAEVQRTTVLCIQYNIIVAQRSMMDKLGLPTDDIPIPDVSDLDCPTGDGRR